MKFRNMQIAINAEQPVEEIVSEVQRLGYTMQGSSMCDDWVVCYDDGYCVFRWNSNGEPEVTLDELRKTDGQ